MRRMYARVIQLSIGILLAGTCCIGVQAANPAAGTELKQNDLNILENRFFSHSYAHDPAEKRLERLECLVFGSTRGGDNSERLAHLMKTVAARSQTPLAADKSAAISHAAPAEQKEASKVPAGSKQYPILNTLEWRALKKTYQNESLDQRLDRLESKLFGQPAQTMAYVDRVERLKKTVGIGLTPEATDGITARGPMPKAQPRGLENGIGGNAVPMPLEGFMPRMTAPFGNMELPLGGDTAFSGIQQMQRMMEKMMEMNGQQPGQQPGHITTFSRTLIFDPKTNRWIEQDNSKQAPLQPKGIITPPATSLPRAVAPSLERPSEGLKEVPGYADPNSI